MRGVLPLVAEGRYEHGDSAVSTACHPVEVARCTELFTRERALSVEAGPARPRSRHCRAAKAAVVMHARAAALGYGPHGIRVNSVSAGLIDREGLARAWPDGVRRRLDAVPPAARAGRGTWPTRACSSPRPSPLITGHVPVVDGGVSARPTW
ncbi:SDR family oxidoreductase [Streptomyces sp. NPDC085866]|uniref:SDR family oxidoreductase n=1 Tax=Streptomyces sp. NPDC085866 TaxID=3365736 RepID=UPI0037D7A694